MTEIFVSRPYLDNDKQIKKLVKKLFLKKVWISGWAQDGSIGFPVVFDFDPKVRSLKIMRLSKLDFNYLIGNNFTQEDLEKNTQVFNLSKLSREQIERVTTVVEKMHRGIFYDYYYSSRR